MDINAILVLFVIALAVICLQLYKLSEQRRGQRDAARDEIKGAYYDALNAASRVAEVAGLDNKEVMEIMSEQSTTLNITSDKWNVPLPYGKWGHFDDPDGDPAPLIRGFWLDCKGRIVGSKMPIGSKYLIHKHDWTETLVGLSGIIWVQIYDANGNYTSHRLGPNEVVQIPTGTDHAVAVANTAAEFLSICGDPQI